MRTLLIFLAVVALCAAEPIKVMSDEDATAVDFITGFLEGLHETKTSDDLLKCVKGIEPIFAKFKAAAEYIAKLTFADMIKGVTLLIEAAKELSEALKPCMEGFEQLKKLVTVIVNADPSKIVWKILVDPAAIISDVTACIEAFKSGDHKAAGKAIGDLLYRIFLTDSFGDTEPIIDFVSGFLIGINEKQSISDLIKCMKNADQILEKITRALNLITKFSFQDLTKGLSLLFEALLELELMLRPCLSEFTQFQKLIAEIADADIRTLVLKIIRNPLPYIQDFNMCLKALDAQNYTLAGQYLGDIMYRLFLVETVKSEDTDFVQFESLKASITFDDIMAIINGLLKGLNQGGKFANIEECASDIPDVKTYFLSALDAFTYINWSDLDNVTDGFIAAVDLVRKGLVAVKPCSKVNTDFNYIIETLQNFNASSVLEIVLHNSMQLIHYATTAIKALSSKQYATFGENIGDLLYIIFFSASS